MRQIHCDSMLSEEVAMARFEGRCKLIFTQGPHATPSSFWSALEHCALAAHEANNDKYFAREARSDAWIAIGDFQRWSDLWDQLGTGEPERALWVLACLRQATFDAATSHALMAHVAASLFCLGDRCPWLLTPAHAQVFCVALDRCARPRGLRSARDPSWGDVELAMRCCESILPRRSLGLFPAWSRSFAAALHPSLVSVHPGLGSLIEQLCLADLAEGSRSARAQRL